MAVQKQYFGTDGIRGRANEKLTPELALRLGEALGTYFKKSKNRRHSVVIGKDTRLSGYMIEYAMAAGFSAVGVDVLLVGPMPTAAVAMLTKTTRADVGIMITASHNPYDDNGIKIFDPDGNKLSDEAEIAIEQMLHIGHEIKLVTGNKIGRVHKDETNRARYVQFAKMIVQGLSLDGMRIVLDCANGAAYKSASEALSELGAEVIRIGCEPDGFNINRDCGSTAMGKLCTKVRELRADVGIALDGDGDRVMFVDELGAVVDGDQLLAVLARQWHKTDHLKGAAVVGTIMSNIGLELYLQTHGIRLVRTAVGDHHVLDRMRASHYSLGGEPSGHVIMVAPQFEPFGTIADGLITALHVLAVMRADCSKASAVLQCFEPVPQVHKQVDAKNGRDIVESAEVQSVLERVRGELGERGRIVVRPSGTEPVVRIMIESYDKELAHRLAEEVMATIRAARA